MPSIDHVASALFKTLTSDQLRDLLAAYIGIDKSAQLTQRTREQIIGHLEAGSNPKHLATLAHRIEMVSPYKHCVPFSSETAKSWTYQKLRDAFQKNLPGLADTFVPLDSASFGLEIQMYLVDPENERIFLKFSHMVDVWETVIKTDKECTCETHCCRAVLPENQFGHDLVPGLYPTACERGSLRLHKLCQRGGSINRRSFGRRTASSQSEGCC